MDEYGFLYGYEIEWISASTATHTHTLLSLEIVERSAFQHKTDWSAGQGEVCGEKPTPQLHVDS